MKLLRNAFWMKMFFIISLLVSHTLTKWCWTKSQVNNPSFRLDSSKGGFNYGECDEAESSKVAIEYSATVTTSLADNSTTSKPILIKLEGTKGSFDSWATLSSFGFQNQGIPEKSEPFYGKDVGQITSISLKLKDDRIGGSRYKCSKIVITKNNVDFQFDCLNPIEPNGEAITITESGIFGYEIGVKTGDSERDGTNGPVHIILFGSKTTSSEKILSDAPLPSGSYHTAEINTKEIGEIIGFKIFLRGQGTWTPVRISIKSKLTGDNRDFELTNVQLQNPGRPSYEMNLKGDPNGDVAGSFSYGSEEAENDEEQSGSQFMDWGIDYSSNLKQQKSRVDSHLDINNPIGGLLEDSEKVKVLSLTCTQVLENTDKNLFGPEYPTQKCEYFNILAKCPSNCHKETGTVFGVSIHPKNSPICLSAIVDKAMPQYGGLISISIFSGLDEYKVPSKFQRQLGKITIKGYEEGNSLKSFVVAKVESIDLVEKDMRIVSWDGSLQNQGRIEFRLQGVWGTVCNLGNNAKSAELICKDLGYKDGKWIKGEDDSQSVCMKFKSQDYCGAQNSKIHFSNLECNDQNSTFSECNKVIADLSKCDYSKNAIINCFNDNFQNSSQIPDKTVRLGGQVDYDRSNGSYTGRLELFYEGRWGPVCNHEFNSKTANVVCKAMKFQKGIYVNDPTTASKYQLDQNSTAKSTAMNLVCMDSTRSDILSCQGEFGSKVECSHTLDVVITCTGNGDPEGKSQYTPVVNNNPPELGKLGVPSYEIGCDTLGKDAKFRGDPGSIYHVKCPAECINASAIIVGTGVYSFESNVCAAAIHAGVIMPNKAESFMFVKVHGLEYYIGSRSRHLESLPNSSNTKSPAFSLAKLNSSWINSVKKWESDQQIKPSSFLEFHLKVSPLKYFREKKVSKLMNLVQQRSLTNSSFLEFKLVVPRPVFSYIEKDSSHIFSKNDKYIFPGGGISKLTKFTIYASINMTDMRQTHDATIFSFGGEDGFSLVIIQSELFLGKLTDKKLTNLNVLIPVNTDFSIFLAFDGERLNYSVIAGSYKNAYKDIKAAFETPSHGKVSVGRMPTNVPNMPTSGIRPFNGKIYYVLIFNDSLPFSMCGAISNFIKQSKKSAEKPTVYTTDQRECISTCMDTPPGSGPTPPEANLNFEVMNEKSGSRGCSNSGPSAMFEGTSQFVQQDNSSNDGKGGSNNSSNNSGNYNDENSGSYPDSSDYDSNQGMGNKSSYSNSNGSAQGSNWPSNDSYGSSSSNNSDSYGSSGSSNDNNYQNSNKSSQPQFKNRFGADSNSQSSSSNQKSQSSVGSFTDLIEQTTNIDTIMLEKDTTLENELFANAYPGIYYRVRCPSKIDSNDTIPIYGTAVFRADSSICFAAMHFGKLVDGVNELIVIVGNKQNAYNGSVGSRKIQSFNGFGEKKLSFTVDTARGLRSINCSDNLTNLFPRSTFGEMYLVSCLEDCTDSSFKIYGGNKNPSKNSFAAISDDSGTHCIYSEDSSICKAALHCGIINKFNRNLKFQVLGEQSNYQPSQSFGVSSDYKGATLRSFSFVSQRIGVVAKFEEDFSNDINKNWIIENCTGKDCINLTSNVWSYYENDSDFSNRLQRKKENIKAIRHTGSISLKRNLTAATILKKRNVDFANAVFTMNILLKSISPVYIYFRYADDMNHFGVEMNNSPGNNIILFRKSQGSTQVLKETHLDLHTNIWYSVEIEIANENIRVKITPDEYHEPLVNIPITVQETSRGTIAFGCNGNDDFMITGISVKPYSPFTSKRDGNPQDTKFTWNKLVSSAQKPYKVKAYCESNFKKSVVERKKCETPQYYCRYKCESDLPMSQYGILNLGCTKDCIAAMLGIKNKAVSTHDIQLNFSLGEKVDFLYENNYIPATIIQLNQTDETNFVKLEFSVMGESRVDTFSLSQGLVFKCGTKLNKADCSKL